MNQEFLLDTNAFYNLLKAINPEACEQGSFVDSIATLKHAKLLADCRQSLPHISNCTVLKEPKVPCLYGLLGSFLV